MRGPGARPRAAKLFRGDLLDAGLNEGFCAFKIDIGAQFLDMLGKDVSVRVAGTDHGAAGSPRVATQNANMLRYLRRRAWRERRRAAQA